MRGRLIAVLAAVVIVSAAVAAVILGIDRVGPGEAVVIASRLGGDGRVLSEGTHWTPPILYRKGRYPLGAGSLSVVMDPGRVTSLEGEPVGLDLEVEIEIEEDLLPALHREFGPQFKTTLLERITSDAEDHLGGRPLRDIYLTRWATLGEEIHKRVSETPLGRLSGFRSISVRRIEVSPEARRLVLAEAGGSGDRRVVLLGIDGADWNIIQPMMDAGRLPHLKRLVTEGARAHLESIHPMLSPLIWTSIVTGKTPDKHGILDFFAENAATGKKVPVTSNLRRVKALWNILSDLDMETCFIDWLASWPAEPVNGVLVSDRLAYHSFDPSPEHYRESRKTYPEDLLGTLAPLVVRDRDVSYDEIRRFLDIDRREFETHVGGSYDPADPIQNFRLIYATTETYRKVGLTLAGRPVRLYGIYFEILDAVSHLFVKHMEPPAPDVPAAEVRKFSRAVEETYRYQDEILGELLQHWDRTQTTVIALSDHGFRFGPLRLRGSSQIHGAADRAAAKWHRLHGFLVMRGPEIRAGVELSRASVLDITPTVLYLLGLPVASDMDGRVLTEAVDPDHMMQNPVLRIPTYESRETLVLEAPIGSPDDERLRERLAALGYIDRDNSNLHNNLAQSYLERGDYEKALAEYRRALELEPDSPLLWSNLGMAYLHMQSYEEAIGPLRQALELRPDFEAALSNLGVAYTYLGRLEEAAEIIERATALEPGRAEFHDNLGVIYSRLGRETRALECFRAAARLEPKFPEPYNNLGAVALEMGNLDEARDSFQRALALDPDLFDTRFNLGLLENKAGNLSDAVREFQAAIRIRPRDPEAYYRLGLVYREMNEKEKARREWRRAAAIDRDGPIGRQARARLEEP